MLCSVVAGIECKLVLLNTTQVEPEPKRGPGRPKKERAELPLDLEAEAWSLGV